MEIDASFLSEPYWTLALNCAGRAVHLVIRADAVCSRRPIYDDDDNIGRANYRRCATVADPALDRPTVRAAIGGNNGRTLPDSLRREISSSETTRSVKRSKRDNRTDWSGWIVARALRR